LSLFEALSQCELRGPNGVDVLRLTALGDFVGKMGGHELDVSWEYNDNCRVSFQRLVSTFNLIRNYPIYVA